jgi:Ca2+-transporting ATPase
LQEEQGFNELPSARRRRLPGLLLEIVREPMSFLLLGCGAIYLILGDRQEAFMLLGFLFIIIGITAYQEIRAERAIDALRELSSPRALVLRDGERKRIPGREVARGDIAFVGEGDRVPADGLSLTEADLAVDESLLTGESVPAGKEKGAALFSGTTVVRGQGVMRVTAIGAQSELGKIGKSIQTRVKEPTRLETETRSLVWKLTWIAAALCVLVVVAYGLTRYDWLSGILVGLSLAMAILPNELPAVLTIFLALGAWRMSQRRVLTRKVPAIENLGAATVLCVDKTGTLTLNRMSIQLLYSNDAYFEVSELTEAPIPDEFHEVLEFGLLASRTDPFDPMEKAFLAVGNRLLGGTEHLHPSWDLKKEYPLSSELLSISHAWKPSHGKEYVVGAKGAPEAIIDLCHLDPATGSRVDGIAREMAERGLRVLGVAKAKLGQSALPEKQHDFDFEFVGLVGLADPIRPGVREAIAECHTAGVRVVMITGDHPDTAQSIARAIGLQNPGRVMTGAELGQVSASDLRKAVEEVNVFSRMVPEQKLLLVNALKENGETVAMTGDGVNDAPALKNANIGIAMGGRGTDVAREASAIVLLDDDFASIVEAIRTGRRVYANLKSAFVYLLSAHVPIAGISVLPVLLKLPLVLLPVHIAFLHLIIEPACSVVFEAEPPAPDTMRRPPRKPGRSLFGKKTLLPSVARGASVLVALLVIFVVALRRGQGEADARALTFTTLIVSNLALIVIISRRGHGRWIAPIVIGSLALLACVLYIPNLRDIFRFSTLHPGDLLLCAVVGILSVLLPTWLHALRSSAQAQREA